MDNILASMINTQLKGAVMTFQLLSRSQLNQHQEALIVGTHVHLLLIAVGITYSAVLTITYVWTKLLAVLQVLNVVHVAKLKLIQIHLLKINHLQIKRPIRLETVETHVKHLLIAVEIIYFAAQTITYVWIKQLIVQQVQNVTNVVP